jgi:hypothetical protein
MRNPIEKAGESITAGDRNVAMPQRFVDSSGLYLLKRAMSSRSLKFQILVNGDRIQLKGYFVKIEINHKG